MCTGLVEHRLALYADDVIIFLKKLDISVPALMDLIKRFGNVSGYKINTSKSSILLCNSNDRNNPPTSVSQFNSVNSFTYLGIQITYKIEEIVQANYNPGIASTCESLEKWSTLPISLLGRINILKMSILPKLLYLFQNIPLPPPSDFFPRFKKLFCNFIWKNRRPRLRLSLLYLPYDRGGLQCPNLLWYYWATQIRTMKYYYNTENSPVWKDIESGSEKIPLPAYLYSDTFKNLKKKTTNPIVKNMIVVWYDVNKYHKETSVLSRFSPIWGNNHFVPGRADGGFKLWADKGIKQMKDIYNPNDVILKRLRT